VSSLVTPVVDTQLALKQVQAFQFGNWFRNQSINLGFRRLFQNKSKDSSSETRSGADR